MKLEFAKMHGAGNDVVVMRWPAAIAVPGSDQLRAWGDRRLGIGYDQLMLIETDYSGPADAAYRVFNADGGEVEQCGNGVRCVARFLADVSGAEELRLDSRGGIVAARILDDGRVTVNLGVPAFAPADLPFAVQREQSSYMLNLGGQRIEFGAVSLGNPHAVILTDSVDDAPVGILGAEFQDSSAFPRGVNVGFMEIDGATAIRLRVFERGVGETLACGTGAAAAVAIGRDRGLLDARVGVSLPGGELEVSWEGRGEPLWLAGPATKVFEGRIEYEPTED